MNIEQSKGGMCAFVKTIGGAVTNARVYILSARDPEVALHMKRLALLIAEAAVLMDEWWFGTLRVNDG